MDVKVHARHHLQLDLRNALAADAFQVQYQPFYNLRTRCIATCEALLRWPIPSAAWYRRASSFRSPRKWV
jgi:sensor c-di-GMP phosphodiesterase-like protein